MLGNLCVLWGHRSPRPDQSRLDTHQPTPRHQHSLIDAFVFLSFSHYNHLIFWLMTSFCGVEIWYNRGIPKIPKPIAAALNGILKIVGIRCGLNLPTPFGFQGRPLAKTDKTPFRTRGCPVSLRSPGTIL